MLRPGKTAGLPSDREQCGGPEPGGESEHAQGDGMSSECCRTDGATECTNDVVLNILGPQLAVAVGIRQDQQECRSGDADAEQ